MPPTRKIHGLDGIHGMKWFFHGLDVIHCFKWFPLTSVFRTC